MLIPAYAKLNLYLEIKGVLPGGYHALDMLMQRISLHDDIYISKNNGGDISFTALNDGGSAYSAIERDKNLAYRAAMLLCERLKRRLGADISLYKRIPMQSGLAGGSSDAAAVLLGLNHLFDLRLSMNELCELGKALGADVPFCLRGGLARVTGIGEGVFPVTISKPLYFVIVKPNALSVDTASAYAAYDRLTPECSSKKEKEGDVDELISALNAGELTRAVHLMKNDLEAAAFELLPELLSFRDELRDISGNSMMTGSGSAVFSIFDDYAEAVKNFERIKKFEDRAQVFFARAI